MVCAVLHGVGEVLPVQKKGGSLSMAGDRDLVGRLGREMGEDE